MTTSVVKKYIHKHSTYIYNIINIKVNSLAPSLGARRAFIAGSILTSL